MLIYYTTSTPPSTLAVCTHTLTKLNKKQKQKINPETQLELDDSIG